MECPACKGPAIDFLEWCQGAAAFVTSCQVCGAELMGDRAQYVYFMHHALGVAVIGCGVGWRFGGYGLCR